MDKKSIHILSTGNLPDECILSARQNNIQVDRMPFIVTKPIIDIPLEKQIEALSLQSRIVIFTSKQAVRPVINLVKDQQPDWRFYCIEGATQRELLRLWDKNSIINTARTGAALAEKIKADHPTGELLFFCGKRRLNEIPEQLFQAGIPFQEVIVYETQLTPKTLENEYEGILFYSPSGVESFFSANHPGNATLFSIGMTTTNKLLEYTANEIITISQPDKAYMLKQAIEYFKQKNGYETKK